MAKKIVIQTLIILFALGLGTQVLLGQILCDLLVTMPCCMGGQAPMPQSPTPKTDCCFIVAPEASGSFTLAPSSSSGHNESKVILSHSVMAKVAVSCINLPVSGPESSQSPLSLFNTPEKLSVFRI